MREILFRGKRLDNGEWVEGFYMSLGNKYHYILTGQLDITHGYPDLFKNPVDPKSVGQYTGVEGCNGKIFEGDILYDGFEEENAVVDFRDGSFWLTYQGHTDNEWYDLADYLSVVGNIHDNPEVLTC